MPKSYRKKLKHGKTREKSRRKVAGVHGADGGAVVCAGGI